MKIRSIASSGDRGVLVTLDDATAVSLAALTARVRDEKTVAAAVTGHESVLVLFTENDTPGARTALIERCASDAASTAAPETPTAVHRLTVSLHDSVAPDLPLLLERAQSTGDAFAEALRHTRFTARFLGFRPGFAYLETVPKSWQLPRRATPRRAVPAGSFAIAGAMAGFYPSESPGGWNLIGRTNAPLWDPTREQPNLISPGDRIEIEPTLAPIEFPCEPVRVHSPVEDPLAEVVAPGQRTLVTGAADLSRLRYGLPPGGPFDERAAQIANGRVGNLPHDAVLECMLVGPSLRFFRDSVLSIEPALPVRVSGVQVAHTEQFPVPAGEIVEVGRLRATSRAVIAISGGIEQSVSPHELEPQLLRAGDRIGSAHATAGVTRFQRVERGHPGVVEVISGPHDVPASALDTLLAGTFVVTAESDRAGVRLRPDRPIDFVPPSGLPSCGMQRGTIQWHPDGDLVVMGPDHPVTGGYLQPATVCSSDLWKIARLSPGDTVRFRLI